MPIQCPDCRTHNRDTANFCENCGTGLVVAATPDQAGPTSATLDARDARVTSAPQSQLDTPAPFPDKDRKRKKTVGPHKKSYGRGNPMGVVTNLRAWQPETGKRYSGKRLPDQVFDLQLTDKDWQPLTDPKGHLLPSVEVEYAYGALQGLSLGEGSQVVVKGRWKRGKVRAKEIENVTSTETVAFRGRNQVAWGRVTEWTRPNQHVDSRGQFHSYTEVWSFRLQLTGRDFGELLTDDRGNRLPFLATEIRAGLISGPLRDGDNVEVRGRFVGGTLYAEAVINHSANASLIIKNVRRIRKL